MKSSSQGTIRFYYYLVRNQRDIKRIISDAFSGEEQSWQKFHAGFRTLLTFDSPANQRLNIHEPVCARGPSKCYADLKPLRRYRKFYCVDRFLLAQFLVQIPTYLNLHHIFASLYFDNIYIYFYSVTISFVEKNSTLFEKIINIFEILEDTKNLR